MTAKKVQLLCNLAMLMLAASPTAAAEVLKVPLINDGEENTVVTYDENGVKRWEAKWALEKITVDGQRMVKFSETGQGRYTSFKQEVRWTVEALWKVGETFSPLRVEKEFTDMEGNLLMTERMLFHSKKGTVKFERLYENGKSLVKELKVPSDALIPEGLHIALSGLPFDSSRPVMVHLLSNEPKLYKVKLEIEKVENIETPGGEYLGYKVKMKPDMGFLNLFKFLIPETYFWFTVGSPHVCVRYEGLESGPDSPQVIMVLKGHE